MTGIENVVWTERYRPDTLGDVRGNEVIVDRMKEWVDDRSMPNILFAGPQGVGKTAMAVAFAKDKYGDDWKQHFKQLNASDDRGIDVVRDEVKSFAQLSTVSDHQFKIIFLDEADALTKDAQPALRRVMEDYSDRTRFFLSCNYPNKIIDPIQSRCTVFRVEPLQDDQLFSLLEDIAEEEGIEYSPDQLEEIVRLTEGDARNAIHTLQSVVIDGEISDDTLDVLAVYPNRESVAEVFTLAVNGSPEEAMENMDQILSRGVDPASLCDEFVVSIKSSDLPQDAKVKMIDKVAETEWRVLNGSKPQIQFNSLIANLRVARHLSLEPYQRDNEGGV